MPRLSGRYPPRTRRVTSSSRARRRRSSTWRSTGSTTSEKSKRWLERIWSLRKWSSARLRTSGSGRRRNTPPSSRRWRSRLEWRARCGVPTRYPPRSCSSTPDRPTDTSSPPPLTPRTNTWEQTNNMSNISTQNTCGIKARGQRSCPISSATRVVRRLGANGTSHRRRRGRRRLEPSRRNASERNGRSGGVRVMPRRGCRRVSSAIGAGVRAARGAAGGTARESGRRTGFGCHGMKILSARSFLKLVRTGTGRFRRRRLGP